MILAPSRQRPLSGNRSILFLILLTFSCVSCGAFGSSTIEVEPYSKSDSEKKDKTPTTEVYKKEKKESKKEVELVERLFNGETYMAPPVDNNFKVAVLLPFMAESEGHAYTNLMLDYLEGIQLSVKRLKESGMNIHVTVHDTKNDVAVINELLRGDALKEVDLIIGPVFEKNVAMVENHCAMFHIPLVVPLKYYSKTTRTDFPLYNMFPCDSVFYESLGRSVKETYGKYSTVTVATSDSKNFFYRKHFSNGYGSTLPVYGAKEISNITKEDTVVVFIPTTAEAQMRLCLNGLKKRENVIVVGLKEWLDFKVIDYPMWNNLNVHYASKYHLDYSDSTVSQLRAEYRETFKGEPSKYFYIAYDEMMYFGEALFAFGSKFPNFIKNREFNYYHNSIRMMERKGFYENTSINFLKFSDYSLELIKE